MALPAVAVGAMWLTGFTAHGWINSLLYYLGIIAEGAKIYWLAGSEWKLLALVILIDAWQVIPSMMIILLAGLQNIPEETIEAGYVFGGNFITVFRKITMPLLGPTIQTADHSAIDFCDPDLVDYCAFSWILAHTCARGAHCLLL